MNEEQKANLRKLIGEKRLIDGVEYVCSSVDYQLLWYYSRERGEVREIEEIQIYEDIAQQINRSQKRLRNLVSAIRNPMAEEAFAAGLTIDAFMEIAPVARDLPDAAAHYIAEASEKSMTVDEVRRMVNMPTAATVETFPTSGKMQDAPAVTDEQRTGVWIRLGMTPEQVYDELTQIFDERWTIRFFDLITTGGVRE